MVHPLSPVAVRREFWRLIGLGVTQAEAAAGAGVSDRTGKSWFAQAGGMSPIRLSEPSGRYLSLAEREEIAVGLAAGKKPALIASELGRHRGTITREIARNSSTYCHQPYRAVRANEKAEARARRPKPAKLATCARLRSEVQTRLEKRLSPEQISARLRLDFPDDAEMRVSHEAIYQALYIQGRGALRRELTKCLRTGRALRKPHRSAAARRPRIKDMVMISARPAEAADRAVPGHWEGDLIIGKNSGSAIGTLVERTTRFTMLLHLPADHGATAVRDAIVTTIGTLPEALRQSLTWDQGIELAEHLSITTATDLPVYFCDPHSPWQRGSNENTNGLLRQYFPKGTNLSIHTADHLATVAAELNARPRKTLGWDTPAERLTALLSEPLKPSDVATTA